MYEVHLSQKAEKYLDKLDNNISERIKKKLKKLGRKPVPSNSKFIGRDKGDKIFRCRIGDYRALYKIKIHDEIVLIAKIDKRSRVYK